MKMSLQNVRYELLYESGIVAMLVGFHREAVSSFASAMERFYEFAIEVFTLRAGIAEATYDAAWKPVKNRSEMQWGAFLFLHLVNFGKPFEATNEKMANFRNGVIHQGRLCG